MSYLSKQHGINTTGSCQIIQRRIHAYKEFGDEGLLRSRKNDTYSFDLKLHVVELYLSTEVSYQELALPVGMNNPPLITKRKNDYPKTIFGPIYGSVPFRNN